VDLDNNRHEPLAQILARLEDIAERIQFVEQDVARIHSWQRWKEWRKKGYGAGQ
jgi:hypothetical protein